MKVLDQYKDRMEEDQTISYITTLLLMLLNSLQDQVKVSMGEEDVSREEVVQCNTRSLLHSFEESGSEAVAAKLHDEFGVVNVLTCVVHNLVRVDFELGDLFGLLLSLWFFGFWSLGQLLRFGREGFHKRIIMRESL